MKQLTKYTMVLVLMLALSACVAPSSEPDEPEVPVDDVEVPTVISPAPPTQITINGETVQLSDAGFLLVGDVLENAVLALPAATFDALETVSFQDYSGWKVIHAVPSLDTPTCSLQTQQIELAAAEFDDVVFMTVSADLPFALNRFCGLNSIENLVVLSDYLSLDFARSNHLLLEDYQLLTRAIIVVDESNTVRYIEYAHEVTEAISITDAVNFLHQNKQ